MQVKADPLPAELWRVLKLYGKPFQIPSVSVQAFPKKALAVLWYFKGLQGFQIKEIRFQIFSSRSPLFSLFQTLSRRISPLRVVSLRVRLRLARDFVAGGARSWQRVRDHLSDTGTGKFTDSMNSDSWKRKFDKSYHAGSPGSRGKSGCGKGSIPSPGRSVAQPLTWPLFVRRASDQPPLSPNTREISSKAPRITPPVQLGAPAGSPMRVRPIARPLPVRNGERGRPLGFHHAARTIYKIESLRAIGIPSRDARSSSDRKVKHDHIGQFAL